ANRHGRTTADVIAGHGGHNTPALGTAIVKVFDLVVAKVGWSERQLVDAGRPYRAIHTHPTSHATYYPGAEGMSIKLLVDPETDAILGAQLVGRDGVDKRTDVIAVAMAGGGVATLADLAVQDERPRGEFGESIAQLVANRHGRTTADVIAGHGGHNTPALGTAIVKVFDLVVAKVGWSERQLVDAGRPYRAIHTHPTSHATYYPGAEGMSIKLL
ncbi:hypothetical protein AB4Z22_40700, partial [Paenibacillus sp. TAF58]